MTPAAAAVARSEPEWPITSVKGYVNGAKVAWWCAAARRWYGNNYDGTEDKLIRCAPTSFADGDIQIEIAGDAKNHPDIQAAIDADEPPPGEWHPGDRVSSCSMRETAREMAMNIVEAIDRKNSALKIAQDLDHASLLIRAYSLLKEVEREGYVAGVFKRDLWRVYSDCIHEGKTVEEAVGEIFPRWRERHRQSDAND